MARRILQRVVEAAETIKAILNTQPSLQTLHVNPHNPATGWFKMRAHLGENIRIDVYESYIEGNLYRYSYSLVVGDKRVLGYDNAPYHPEVETFPHHKHVGGRVEPLENPSLEAFLREAKQLLQEKHGEGPSSR